MARLDFYLVITMVISLIWGIFVLALGAMIRLSLGQLVGNYVEGVTAEVPLGGTVNKAGQNIVPVITEIPNTIDLGDWASKLGAFVIVAGVAVILFSIVGFVAGLKRNNPLLILVIIIIIVAIALQYYLLKIATDEGASFHDTARDELVQKLQNEYSVEATDSDFSTTMNAIMLTGECCGIIGMKDFGNVSFLDRTNNKEYIFKVPPACCRRSVFSSKKEDVVYEDLKRCAEEGWSSSTPLINTEGCYSVVYEYLKDKYGVIIMVGLICLAVWEMLQLILAVLLIFTPKPPPPKPSKKPSVTEEMAEEKKPKPKVFIPFSKISSFQHPDVNRIKSTEIW